MAAGAGSYMVSREEASNYLTVLMVVIAEEIRMLSTVRLAT